MAKKQSTDSNGTGSESESISGYFRKVFAENPKLLFERSNKELLDRWLRDHPEATVVPKNVQQNLANIKSVLRKKKRKRGRPKQDATVPTNTAAAVANQPLKKAVRNLETLEEHIDDCLSLAKSLGRDELANVIVLLRKARNEVVWKMGV